MIKGSTQEEDITIKNTYAPNIEAPQYVRQIVTTIKGKSDSNTVIMGDFDTPLSSMDRSSRQETNQETQALNDTCVIRPNVSINVSLIFIENSVQKQQNTHFSQVYKEHSLGLTTHWATRRALVNLRKLKSYQATFPIIML